MTAAVKLSRPTLGEELRRLRACGEATDWVGERDLPTAWAECARGDWLLWLAGRAGVDRRLVVEAACRCAEAVIGLVPEGEERPIRAIEAARAWIRGEASLKEVRRASAAAYAAAYAAYAASDAAYAYADAAYAAYAAAYAADAASAAASAAAYAAADADDARRSARAEALAGCADLVRQVITAEDIAMALEAKS